MENKSKIVDRIIKTFPEFVNSEYYHGDLLDLPYVFIGDFGDYFQSQINKSDNKNVVEIIEFINRSYNNGSLEEQNQLFIGIFEVVGGNANAIELLNNSLIKEALKDFSKLLNKEIF